MDSKKQTLLPCVNFRIQKIHVKPLHWLLKGKNIHVPLLGLFSIPWASMGCAGAGHCQSPSLMLLHSVQAHACLDWHPGSHAEVTDFHVLVHSPGTCYLYQTPFPVFYKKQKISRGRHYCCSMWWFRRCSKPQLGKEMTPALTSCFTSPLMAELWPAGATLGAWLRLIGENQLLAGFAVFKKYYTALLVCQNHTCSPHRLLLASGSPVRGLAAVDWKPWG